MLQFVFQCEEIREQTDEQASPTSWNVIPHLAPRPEPPRCSLRILGLEPEPVLIPVAFPELPSNNQTEYFTTVVHRARLFSVMVPKPDNLIADECEEIRGQTDEQASQTSWNVIPHLAPRPEPPRCCLRILGLEPEPVLIPVAFPELPSNNQTEYFTTVVHRARLFSVMVPKPDNLIADEVIIDKDEMVEVEQALTGKSEYASIVFQCEEIRGQTDEQASPTSWNVIAHLAPRPEPPRCCLRILGFEPEPCEEIRGQTDEQASPTSWNVIPHLAPRPEPPRCSLRILGLEPEPVLIPVAFPELPSNNQTEYFTTVVHRARLFSVMVPKPDNLIADEVIIDKDEMVEVEQALTGKSEYASIVFQCEEIRGQTDEQASPTSWNVIAHLAPRPEPPRCCLRILGFEPEPVLIPVAFPELPSNNQTEYFTTVVHRARLFSVMVPKPDNLIADEVIIDKDKDEMVEVEQALTGKAEYASIVFQCEEIRGQTDEQASPTSWNFIAHLAPRPEPPRCCLRILGFEPEPVLIPVAFPELPSNNQTEYFTTVVHRARLFSVMVPKPDNLIADEVIIDKDEMVEVEQGREELLDSVTELPSNNQTEYFTSVVDRARLFSVMVPKPDNQIADEVIIDKDKDEMVEVKQARE
ncbi:unnamed protein product [Mytilus coruscus]|uniref:Uncharacterized protein n=1 Tax=Mytilus coruscus TaxID=42192 RepID=A0A6J8C9Q8_MYTCO|nr:unnamed protein product [Mytilus coruscus]